MKNGGILIETYKTPVTDYYGIDTGTISMGFIVQHNEEADQYSLLGLRYSDGREEIFDKPIICEPSSMEVTHDMVEYPDRRGGTWIDIPFLSNSEIAIQKYMRDNSIKKDKI